MGRNKIPIEKIQNDKSRQATFSKRKHGLFKKAMELSILCDCEIAVIIYGPNEKLFQYSSGDIAEILEKLQKDTDPPLQSLTNKEYRTTFASKEPEFKKEDSSEETNESSFIEDTDIKFHQSSGYSTRSSHKRNSHHRGGGGHPKPKPQTRKDESEFTEISDPHDHYAHPFTPHFPENPIRAADAIIEESPHPLRLSTRDPKYHPTFRSSQNEQTSSFQNHFPAASGIGYQPKALWGETTRVSSPGEPPTLPQYRCLPIQQQFHPRSISPSRAINYDSWAQPSSGSDPPLKRKRFPPF